MWRRIQQLIRGKERPQRQYVHPALGKFDFESDLGWKRNYLIDGRNVEIVLGSDGEIPTADMTNTAADWARHWGDRRADVIQYIAEELSTWHQDWSPTVANRLKLSSIHVLWPESPTTAMLYFDAPDDNVRSWHVTYFGREPKGFAFDD